ncbi:CHRD domain-containing protein [Pseudoduganella sp. LjRoot289]|uniref:CHRD domain-containing protein n=1 Tax=Pseudoduganella sp. LjRoot289 TaxID=3342314 RepID=UPI003ECE35F3
MKTPIKIGLAFCALMLAATAASAAPATYTGSLAGAAESPPNASSGTGSTVVTFDLTAHMLTVDVIFAGMTGQTTAAHIHCCTSPAGVGSAGVATETPSFSSFPLGVTGGMYSMSYNTSLPSSWSQSFLDGNGGTTAGAEAAFGAGLASGAAYLNIHSNLYSAGEIRGFLAPVPEPGSWAMLLLGVPVVLGWRRRQS